MSDETPDSPAETEPRAAGPTATEAPEPQALPLEPPVAQPPKKTLARSWRRVFMVLGPLVVSTWVCCAVIGYRSCSSMAPGSTNQTEARAAAQRYLDAITARDWARMYQLTDPALRAQQSLEAQRDLVLAHPELFEFDAASFEGHSYFSNMGGGGDRLRLTGRLTGRSPARRVFRMDMQQQPDETWLVLGFHVNIDLASVPAATPSPQAPPP